MINTGSTGASTIPPQKTQYDEIQPQWLSSLLPGSVHEEPAMMPTNRIPMTKPAGIASMIRHSLTTSCSSTPNQIQRSDSTALLGLWHIVSFHIPLLSFWRSAHVPVSAHGIIVSGQLTGQTGGKDEEKVGLCKLLSLQSWRPGSRLCSSHKDK